MKDQDVRILERDLIALEAGFPERKDVLSKAKMLVKDNYKLRDMLAEQNKVKDSVENKPSHLDNLLLAQILEYERDKIVYSQNHSSAALPAQNQIIDHGSDPFDPILLQAKSDALLLKDVQLQIQQFADKLKQYVDKQMSKVKEQTKRTTLEEPQIEQQIANQERDVRQVSTEQDNYTKQQQKPAFVQDEDDNLEDIIDIDPWASKSGVKKDKTKLNSELQEDEFPSPKSDPLLLSPQKDLKQEEASMDSELKQASVPQIKIQQKKLKQKPK